MLLYVWYGTVYAYIFVRVHDIREITVTYPALQHLQVLNMSEEWSYKKYWRLDRLEDVKNFPRAQDQESVLDMVHDESLYVYWRSTLTRKGLYNNAISIHLLVESTAIFF